METPLEVYRELQRHLDKMPVGFPATKSGVEIRILKHLFTPEEANIALNLSAVPESLGRIHRRVKKSGVTLQQLEEVLDHLVEKGAIMGGKMLDKGRKGKYYSKAQLAIGMFEFQIDRGTLILGLEVCIESDCTVIPGGYSDVVIPKSQIDGLGH